MLPTLFDVDDYPKLRYYTPIVLDDKSIKRFVAKVYVDPNNWSGCWLWTGVKARGNRGQFKLNKKKVLAPRFSYTLYKGVIPHGQVVCHSCDNPTCVNPAHLWLGTQGDNLRDCVAKGRHHLASKTHCPQGHEYAGDNVYYYPNGRRKCRTCHRELQRRARAKL